MRACLREPGDETFDYLDTFLSCKLCKKKYTGVVLRALGWGIWKMRASKPADNKYYDSILLLSLALFESGRISEALEALKASSQLPSHEQLAANARAAAESESKSV
jgi:hypothetical protein